MKFIDFVLLGRLIHPMVLDGYYSIWNGGVVVDWGLGHWNPFNNGFRGHAIFSF